MPALLAIIPHPDDESYSFGGTLALAAAASWRCLVQCATSGERGKRHDGGPLAQRLERASFTARLAGEADLDLSGNEG